MANHRPSNNGVRLRLVNDSQLKPQRPASTSRTQFIHSTRYCLISVITFEQQQQGIIGICSLNQSIHLLCCLTFATVIEQTATQTICHHVRPNPAEIRKLGLLADNNASSLENALNFEVQLEKTQKEARTVEVFLDDIRDAFTAWADLLRKLPSAERDAGETEFNAYVKKEKINEKADDASSKLRDLRDLIGTLTVQARLYRNRADTEGRQALATHQRAMQQAASPNTAASPAGNGPEFYESYKSAIAGYPISKAEKFNILRNLLIGEARDLVAGFRLEDQNYDVALQLLKDTYGAPEEHIRALHFELGQPQIL
uniref:Uncharacterized protein n=1 Tax=Globodera rostochiensis TaxID=31243 RepID=A0A914H8V9_GLORO